MTNVILTSRKSISYIAVGNIVTLGCLFNPILVFQSTVTLSSGSRVGESGSFALLWFEKLRVLTGLYPDLGGLAHQIFLAIEKTISLPHAQNLTEPPNN